jgi:hypothetical protein
MTYRQKREQPKNWKELKTRVHRAWALPIVVMAWLGEWTVYFISRSIFLEILEYVSSLGVLVAVTFYFAGSGDRLQQRHLQMWQVMNTAQGKGGSGGRIEALQELNHDHVPLVGVDVSGAFLQAVNLQKAVLVRANLDAADAREGDFTGADLGFADLHSGNFRDGRFVETQLRDADCSGADLSGADLSRADLSNADFSDADLRAAVLRDAKWTMIKSVKRGNIFGVKNAPAGFVEWALKNGAVQTAQ